jgi:hypothetical protein
MIHWLVKAPTLLILAVSAICWYRHSMPEETLGVADMVDQKSPKTDIRPFSALMAVIHLFPLIYVIFH